MVDPGEITRENLVVKNNGSIITEPSMCAGIPLEVIDEGHGYWDDVYGQESSENGSLGSWGA